MAIEGYNSERCIVCGVSLVQRAAVYSYMSGGQNLIGCSLHAKNDFWKKAYAVARGDKEDGTPAPSTEPKPEVKREEPLSLEQPGEVENEVEVVEGPFILSEEATIKNEQDLKDTIRKLKEKLDAKSQN